MYSACVILNLALLYNVRASLSGTNRYAYSKRAELLYDKVHDLTLLKDDYSSFDTGIVLFLRMAAANNASLLRFLRGNFGRALEDLQIVASVMCSLRNGNNALSFLDEQEVQGFLSNVFRLLTTQQTAPAA